MSQDPNPQALSGQLIAHYRVARLLGSGGMGEVFLAEDTKLDRSVALKLLPKDVAADASRRKRFLAEAKSASALNHSNVCTIYEVGETAEGQPFIAMEYLEGQTLDTLARRRRLELREIVRIGLQVAEALEAARQSQVVHRDIKPGNIVVLNPKSEIRNPNLLVKVLDFGLAKRLDQTGEASVMTQEGAILGTPNYLSPELALGREVDSRSDIFSLGVVLYELAARQNPFAGASFGETVNNILNKDPDPLKPWNPTVTAEFERIVRKCLEKDVAKRYGTPAQLREDLAKQQTNLQTPRSSGQKLRSAAVVVVAAGLLVLIASWAFHRGQRSAAPRHIEALAVLPFQNRSGDPTQDYFADGMTEALTIELEQIGKPLIIDHSSVLPFKGGRVSRPEIIRKLGVDAVVEGAVFRAGERVRIDAKLIEAGTDRYLWAKSYERDLKDVIFLQRELAVAIASEIQVRLTPAQTARLASARRVDPDAYELLLKARQNDAWTAVSITNVLALLEQSIRIDPGDPNAQAALATCYAALPVVGLRPPSEVRPLAMAAAMRAIALDPELAEAHDTLGRLKWRFEWDFSGAEREMQRAIELNPNSASAHVAYAYLLSITSRFDEAINQMLTFEKLKPGSEGALQQSGFIFYLAGRHDEAIGRFEKASSLGPDTATRLALVAGCCLRKGQHAESISTATKGRNLVAPGADQMADAYLAEPFARAGRQEEVRQWVEAWERAAAARFVEPFLMALMTAPTGNRDKTFEWLERGCRERSVNMPFLKVHPILEDLRSEPQFTELLKKVGFDGSPAPPTLAINATAAVAPKSVAVLPFVNMSADKADEPLSDGITDELISTLQPVHGLQVKGRASSFYFKGKNERLQKIGQDLQVKFLVEGTVSRAGNKLRITVDLVTAADESQLWATNYDRPLDDLLAIRTDVATRVAESLKGKLLGEERQQLAKRGTENAEAYRLYLQGRHAWERRTSEDVKQAIEYFNQALGKDPGYALAYSGLADCYSVLPTYTGLPRPEALPKARAAALKALELDSTLGQAHISLAEVKAYLDRDWSGAEAEFRRAIELNPNYATAHYWFADVLNVLGRREEALIEMRLARELDPLSRVINAMLGYQLFLAGNPDAGVQMMRKQLALDPSFVVAHHYLGWVYYHQGRLGEALSEFETAHKLDEGGMFGLDGLGGSYARLGRTNDAQRLLAQLQEHQRQGIDHRVNIAWVQHVLGDEESALDSLEKAAVERAYGVEDVGSAPGWENLRSHPRFQAILRKMNLVPASTRNAPATVPQKSVAVLPFVNMSSDKENEYLSDGMTEEVLNMLAKVKGLRVPARTSCFVFKGKTDDVRKIGEQLSVATVLEGSVRKAGNQLRITAQLINVADGFHLWSETYDRDVTNIFAIQSDIASRVAEALKGQLLGEEQQQLAKPTTANVDAYRLYLLGRYLWSRATDENLKQAINCFEQAVAKDPGYALAHAGLADCYTLLDYYTGQPVAQTYPKARAAALKALELDSGLAEARTVLASIKCRMDWDWKGAEEEYRRTIALNPNSAAAHARLSGVFLASRRYEEALAEIKLAKQLDPLSPDINTSLGFDLSYNGKADLGIEILQKQIALDPASVSAHNDLGWVYFDQGRYPEAVAEFETVRSLKGSGIHERAGLGCSYARVGRADEARKILSQLMDLPRQGLNYHVSIAAVQHALGEDEAALDSMEKALEEHSSGLNALNWGLFWSDLRPHPRAQAILRKMNLVK